VSRDVYLLSPSGAVAADVLELAVENLRRAGLTVAVDPGAARRYQRFAGTDEQRLAAFGRALAAKETVVMAVRGGYGLTRLLHRIDWKALDAAGKTWLGHSDFTALHLAMIARRGRSLRSRLLAGPTATFAARPFDAIDEVTLECLLETLDGQTEALGFKSPRARRFDCAGVLWGGNLAICANLCGTPYFPRVEGGIFFCEDVGEYPYRVERALSQLLHAGVLQRQNAVLIGHFTEYRLTDNDNGFDLPAVWKWLREQLAPHGVPVLTGLPFGHVDTLLTLRVGAEVSLIVEPGQAFLVWSHSHLAD
jgi:muramoyltetrapeptide carboxypeptidase